jgi:hypothetical protein
MDKESIIKEAVETIAWARTPGVLYDNGFRSGFIRGIEHFVENLFDAGYLDWEELTKQDF